MRCDEVRPRLVEYMADVVAGREGRAPGEVEAIEQHLAACAACRAEAERLRRVEEALWSYPGVEPPPGLTAAVMRRVARERSAPAEEWQLFSWDVWVPVVAVALALVVTVVFIPSQLLPAIPGVDVGSAVAAWSEQLNAWLAPLGRPAQGGVVWAILGAILATTAGLGLSLALNAFPAAEVRELESRMGSAASRLWDMARRAH